MSLLSALAYLKEKDNISSLVETSVDRTNGRLFFHNTRVSLFSVEIALEMGLSLTERRVLEYAARVHDIGKTFLAASLLNAPRALTREERAVVETHSKIGADYLARHNHIDKDIPMIVCQHHERHDGAGYPYGISGRNISRPARIIAVADVYDALITDRPYRSAMDAVSAMSIIWRGCGTQFDPEIVPVFAKVADRLCA